MGGREGSGTGDSVSRLCRVRYNFVRFTPADLATFVRILQTSDALFIDATGRLAVGFPLANACFPIFSQLSRFRWAQLPGYCWQVVSGAGGAGRPASGVRLANRSGGLSGPSTRHKNNRNYRGANRLHCISPQVQ